ncbi:MAG: sigma-70 family RNA polymerase sigma factor [Archangium sp.]|nr:sigma-70 family RNA polymerase sigma factor [Archangium sp.]
MEPSPAEASEDATLVESARAGVRSALERLIRKHNQQLYRIARAQLGHDDEAEDVTQHAWVQIVSSLHQWNGRGVFAAWAATIVVNACRARRRGVVEQTSYDEAADERMPPPAPDEETQRLEVRRVLERTVDELPQPLRVVFVMRDVEGFSSAEVGASLGISEEAVRVRLFRARQTLQRSLDAQFQGEARALYPFMGTRCDRITHAVLEAVAARDA